MKIEQTLSELGIKLPEIGGAGKIAGWRLEGRR